jgi:hypothetical protein
MDEGSGSPNRPAVLEGRWLEYFTLGWNALEAVIAVGAGIFAWSTALVGFGIDSVIESLSGAVLLWRLSDGKSGEERERRALKLVGVSFLVLAAYVAYEATETTASAHSGQSRLARQLGLRYDQTLSRTELHRESGEKWDAS